jgi:hypothetical protein
MRRRTACLLVALASLTAGCGGKATVFSGGGQSAGQQAGATGSPGSSSTPSGLGIPEIATKNTTRIAGADPVSNAAAVALAVFPSRAAGTHPAAVALAPTDDWQAALAASSLMAAPFRAPLLLSGPGRLPGPTAVGLRELAPTGETGSGLGGTQAFAVGDVPVPAGLHSTRIPGSSPYALAAAIDHYEAGVRGREGLNVIIASAQSPAYAMPAAGYSAESGEPILYVDAGQIPAVTKAALAAHHHPHIYVLGPPSVISAAVFAQLQRFGTVKRIDGPDPAANSVAFASYRDPACTSGQPCVHVPHSFGWAIRSPGHAYVLIPASDPLEAAAAAALSSSGGYGPQLLVQDPNTLPHAVLQYFLNYATPGYDQEGPTAAVYNHGWLIGDAARISLGVQSQLDSLLEVVPQR